MKDDEVEAAVAGPASFRITSEGTVVSVNSDVAWFKERGYGELGPDGLLTLSPVEALYLLRAGKISVSTYEGRVMKFEELLEIQSGRVANLWRDYVIYMDLRNRRYVVKEGFGEHLRFRVFERGAYPDAP
ncbi:MAG: hypothetical protein QXX57_06070, partial [Nitrososphaerota archaeon]